jgi:hypothetical protein
MHARMLRPASRPTWSERQPLEPFLRSGYLHVESAWWHLAGLIFIATEAQIGSLADEDRFAVERRLPEVGLSRR